MWRFRPARSISRFSTSISDAARRGPGRFRSGPPADDTYGAGDGFFRTGIAWRSRSFRLFSVLRGPPEAMKKPSLRAEGRLFVVFLESRSLFGPPLSSFARRPDGLGERTGRAADQSALISCRTLLVLRTASAEAANFSASSFVSSIFTIFSMPLRPMIAGTPMQMSS